MLKRIQKHSYKDKANFHSAFSATMLSYATRFRRKWERIENFEYLGEFEENFQKCLLYILCFVSIHDWKMQKKF
jgi:hypothetical protein